MMGPYSGLWFQGCGRGSACAMSQTGPWHWRHPRNGTRTHACMHACLSNNMNGNTRCSDTVHNRSHRTGGEVSPTTLQPCLVRPLPPPPSPPLLTCSLYAASLACTTSSVSSSRLVIFPLHGAGGSSAGITMAGRAPHCEAGRRMSARLKPRPHSLHSRRPSILVTSTSSRRDRFTARLTSATDWRASWEGGREREEVEKREEGHTRVGDDSTQAQRGYCLCDARNAWTKREPCGAKGSHSPVWCTVQQQRPMEAARAAVRQSTRRATEAAYITYQSVALMTSANHPTMYQPVSG